jgi:trehalose/maltose hydrolase-like predicted phosphorylase
VPTPESAAAFAKLVETRSRLNEVSALLTKALDAQRFSLLRDEHYEELQKRWDDAFCDFETATKELAAIVIHIKRPEA